MGARVAIALVLAGCTPALPFFLGETAEALKKKQVAVDFGMGGGGAHALTDCCGGGTARLRVGVGRRQELGLDFLVAGKPLVVGAKLVWKLEARRWLGVIVGAGATGQKGSSTGGGGFDLALVASSRRLGGNVRIYGGARAGIVFPFERDPFAVGGLTTWLTLPLGFTLEASENVEYFIEAGMLGAWAYNRASYPGPNELARHDFYGGYAALAFRFRTSQ